MIEVENKEKHVRFQFNQSSNYNKYKWTKHFNGNEHVASGLKNKKSLWYGTFYKQLTLKLKNT